MTPSDARSEAVQVFTEMRSIMERDGEENWIRGIDSVIETLNLPSPGDALVRAFTTYQAMLSGMGSFSDYFVWRDDPDARVYVNARFDALRSRGWDLLLAAKTNAIAELRPVDLIQ